MRSPLTATLRPMQRSDVQAVAALVAATPLWQRHGVDQVAFAARLTRGLDDDATILVATAAPCGEETAAHAEQITGFVWYVVNGAFARSGYILSIGVGPDWRGQGIGHALMDAAEQALFAHANDIFLLVSDFNQAAQHFYATRGYVQVGALPDYVTPEITELILRKRRSE
jgi:ribosomal protein S18 acetylase RimI-like enzyme